MNVNATLVSIYKKIILKGSAWVQSKKYIIGLNLIIIASPLMMLVIIRPIYSKLLLHLLQGYAANVSSAYIMIIIIIT